MESVEQLKFVPVKNGTTLEDIHGLCPKCGFNFQGPDVKEHIKADMRGMDQFSGYSDEELDTMATDIAKDYGWTPENPVHFSLIIGIELPGSNNQVVMHQCSKCETAWDRFSKKEGKYELEIEEYTDAEIQTETSEED
jgi:hypothetical protein